MKISYRFKPTPWLQVSLKKEPELSPPWIPLISTYSWTLGKDDPDGPLGGWWFVIHREYMYQGKTWYKAVWSFITKYKDDRYLV